MKQKILYFVPDCPVKGAAGNITRFQQMLKYLNDTHDTYEVDFVSLIDWGWWDNDSVNKFKNEFPYINLILLNRKIGIEKFFKSFFFYKIPNVISKLLKGISVDISNPFLNKKFTKILNAKKYDKVIISYACWGNLVRNINYKSYLILDTHDFMTAQNRNKIRKIGKYFQSEIEIINIFDEIWTYSVEEEYIFGQFSNKKITFIPISFPFKEFQINKNHKYDVIFVGSNNPHNKLGINWFIDNVLPYLGNTKIHIIGKICSVIGDYPNVVKHGMVQNIEHFYQNARISICPMFSGTGIKIKVLEALSYSIPVVTNRRGVDGLINKSLNGCIVCDDGKTFAEFIINLIKDDELYLEKRSEASKYFNQNHSQQQEKEVLSKIFFK